MRASKVRKDLRKPYASLSIRYEFDEATAKVHERLVLFDADPIGKLLWSRMVLVDGAVVVMMASDLLGLCAPSNQSITIVVPRAVKGVRARIVGMPGVLGLVQESHPEGTVVTIATKDIRRCYIARLDMVEATAVRLAETAKTDAVAEAAAKWMDEYRKILAVAREWKVES